MKTKKRFDELSPYKIIHHDIHREYPIHVEIDPTAVCQQDCVRCSYTQKIDGARDYIIYDEKYRLPHDRFIELIDEFEHIGMRSITLSGGGEPLIYPRISNIIEKIFSSGIQLGMITNLSARVDTELLSKAIWIRASIDAATPETYLELHRPKNNDAFDLVLSNIESLVSHNKELDIGVNFLIQPENYTEIYDAAVLAKGLGAKYIRFTPAITGESEELDYTSLYAKSDYLLRKSKQLISDDFHIFIPTARFEALDKQPKNYSKCYKQQIHPMIGADGNLYPCCLLKYYDRHILGNILNESFSSVWKGEKRRNWVKNLDVDNCPSCWFDETNSFIEYMLTENPKHVNFV